MLVILTTQLSVTVGGVHVTLVPQVPVAALAFTVIVVGQLVMTGFVASVTTTLKLQVAVLPAASVAVYVTRVVPTGKKSPGDLLLVNVNPVGQLSDAVGAVQVTFVPQTPAVELALILIGDGHPEIEGGWMSFTCTVNEHVEVLP